MSQRAVENREKWRKTGCEIICGAQTTLAVKGQMMMMMCFHATGPLGLLLSSSGHGIFNVHNDLNACCAVQKPEGETGSAESTLVLTRKN